MEAAATTTKTRKPRATTQKAEDAVAKVEKAAGGEPGKLAPKKETVQQLKNRLRNEAEREVLNDHKDEVIAKTEAKYKEHNLEYVRRLSDEEKAAKQIEELYAQFPHLRPQAEQQSAQEEVPEPVAAVPGGALATFRAGDYEYTEDPEVEAREGE